jgi:hypothetical protein
LFRRFSRLRIARPRAPALTAPAAPRAAAAKPSTAREASMCEANAQRHAGHSREASTTFSEACTAFLRIMSRIDANASEHFRRAALRSGSQFIAMPARYEFAGPLTLISARRTLRCRCNGLRRLPMRCRKFSPGEVRPFASSLRAIHSFTASEPCSVPMSGRKFYIAASVIFQIHMSGANIIATDRRPLA